MVDADIVGTWPMDETIRQRMLPTKAEGGEGAREGPETEG